MIMFYPESAILIQVFYQYLFFRKLFKYVQMGSISFRV
jgi:hypothetical protein